jgi:hypothetical protein
MQIKGLCLLCRETFQVWVDPFAPFLWRAVDLQARARGITPTIDVVAQHASINTSGT